jgi:hypothetical protein
VASILDGVTIGALADASRHLAAGARGRRGCRHGGARDQGAVLLLRFKLNSSWVIVAGTTIGTILGIVRAR